MKSNKTNSRPIRIKNKTDLPDNIYEKQIQIKNESIAIEKSLPRYFDDFFLYLKNSISPSSRLAYLQDIQFFLSYLVKNHASFLEYDVLSIPLDLFKTLHARDINIYIDYCSSYTDSQGYSIVNNNRSLARKKSSLSVLFKFMYRNELIPNNIVDGFNPIKLPKKHPDQIKKLEIDEVSKLFEIVKTGKGLTSKEKSFWEKTKYRDTLIFVLFLTYGLRVSELQQLDLDSFNYSRNEFKIYRKRDKESLMPLNNSVINALNDYITLERNNMMASDEPALLLSLQNKRMTIRAIRDITTKYTALAMEKEKGFSPHKLRATAASSLIEYGFSIYDVQNLLDHENITTTQLYATHKKNAKLEIIRQYEVLDDE